jgi:N-methylhydantoinase A/oxoprolinase/acetone carboxylase beta subunit
VDLVRSWADPGDHRGAARAAAELASAAGATAPEVQVAFDCRYAGQSHELTVAAVAEFPAEHDRRNGFTMDGTPVEVIAIRASARWPSPVDLTALPRTDRAGMVAGPAVIAEPDCTVWVAPGWQAAAHPAGSWLLTRVG